jgi:hypothetical protein
MAPTQPTHLASEIQVERITDPNSDDLDAALELYGERIPESEQFEPPDIVRWIRQDLEQIERGVLRPRDFFLVAKVGGQVCGFVLFHYYPAAKLAFIAYLVAAKDQRSANVTREGISKRLLHQVRTFMEGPLKDCEGILLEVDRPSAAETNPEMVERLSRIRLFCRLAQAQGFSLRAFDIDYLQPPLSLEKPNASVPMMLMYVNPQHRHAASSMKATAVRKILKFIYTDLYPEGYSDNESENSEYKKCLRKFCTARAKGLPKKISLLDYKQVKARAMESKAKELVREIKSDVLPVRSELNSEELPKKRVGSVAKLRAATKLGTFYLLDWALLGIFIASAFAFGGVAMSEAKYTLAEILFGLGILLFMAKSFYDHRNHELRNQLHVIFMAMGLFILIGLVIWVEADRREYERRLASGNKVTAPSVPNVSPAIQDASPSPISTPGQRGNSVGNRALKKRGKR